MRLPILLINKLNLSSPRDSATQIHKHWNPFERRNEKRCFRLQQRQNPISLFQTVDKIRGFHMHDRKIFSQNSKEVIHVRANKNLLSMPSNITNKAKRGTTTRVRSNKYARAVPAGQRTRRPLGCVAKWPLEGDAHKGLTDASVTR